jgi:hypothetical protein
MNKADEEFQLKIHPRPTETVSINIPVDALESLKQIALSREMSWEGLIRFYIGQGLRQDIADRYAERILDKTAQVLTKHISSPEEIDAILQEIQGETNCVVGVSDRSL